VAWVDLMKASALTRMSERTLYRWAVRGLVKARRLARGYGPLRFAVDGEGLIEDGDGRPPRWAELRRETYQRGRAQPSRRSCNKRRAAASRR
jgi:hypothetical protein